LVVSVGPPDRAVEIAGMIAASARRGGVTPLVAELNAISPMTVSRIATDVLAPAGIELVDGAISGPPPSDAGRTIVYLSGRAARRIADLDAPEVDTRVVGDRPGQASAVKMCTASVYKGFTGLLLQAMLTAGAYDCVDVVVADLADVYRGIGDWAARRLAMAASKSGRWVGEMREIAATQAAAGARPELFDAMARVWEMVAGTPLAEHTPEAAARDRPLAAVLAELRGG
jgi:3-hydroxyisobutyrate dehydrogenase-like beta-hydroxyacid dehydrogenase